MNENELNELKQWADLTLNRAMELGLDPGNVSFDLAPPHIIYELAGYGLPNRYSHWTFGRNYYIEKTKYSYGLGKIFELVFNTDPAQAFLMEGNSITAQKMVIAHVYGHTDFFRRSLLFKPTNKNMAEVAARNRDLLEEYRRLYGDDEVESILDAGLSLSDFVTEEGDPIYDIKVEEEKNGEYDDIWDMLYNRYKKVQKPIRKIKSDHITKAVRDILGFVIKKSTALEDWQRDILSIIREESLYFMPQRKTKVMNEGWATYWHEKLLEECGLPKEEHVEFRKLHSSIIARHGPFNFNPYALGYAIFKDIERRWSGDLDWKDDVKDDHDYAKPDGRQPLEVMFDAVQRLDDASFIQTFLTPRIVEEQDLYVFGSQKVPVTDERYWMIEDTRWKVVRDNLVFMLYTSYIPDIIIADDNYKAAGGLYLVHMWDPAVENQPDLDIREAIEVVRALKNLWGKNVYLETKIEGETKILTKDGIQGIG